MNAVQNSFCTAFSIYVYKKLWYSRPNKSESNCVGGEFTYG